MKALGFNCVSFYLDWALLEGKSGDFSAEGVFALEPFYEAATAAGIYLIARPGPYINAEVSGGGFPGWLARLRGRLRTEDADYIAATQKYVVLCQSLDNTKILAAMSATWRARLPPPKSRKAARLSFTSLKMNILEHAVESIFPTGNTCKM